MPTDIHIPPEVVEAASKALDNDEGIYAALLAAINAWPGMRIKHEILPRVRGKDTDIILPLPQENGNG